MGFGDAVTSAGPYADNLHLAPTDKHANTLSLNFYRPDALPDAQPTVSKPSDNYAFNLRKTTEHIKTDSLSVIHSMKM